MKNLVFMLILIIATISCSDKKKEPPKIYPNIAFERKYKVYGDLDKSRIILFHGMNSDDSYYSSGGGRYLKDALVEQGHQVITVNYPNTTRETFVNAGKLYREDFLSFMEWLILVTDEELGTPLTLSVGGFSMGGLHAFIAASEFDEIKKIFGLLPVTDPEYLFKGVGSLCFNAFSEVFYLKDKKSLVIAGTRDGVLGRDMARAFSEKLGRGNSYYEVDIDHRLNDEVIDIATKWIK